MIPHITPLEKDFLKLIEEQLSDYANMTIEEDAKDVIGHSVWTPTTDAKSVGVLSSLVKKKLVETDYVAESKDKRPSKDSLCWLTALGYETIVANK